MKLCSSNSSHCLPGLCLEVCGVQMGSIQVWRLAVPGRTYLLIYSVTDAGKEMI